MSSIERQMYASIGVITVVCAASCVGSAPEPDRDDALRSAQVFRTSAGVASKPLVARTTGLAVADELAVTLATTADAHAMVDVAADVGAEIIARAPHTGVYVLRFIDGAEARRAHARLSRHPDVAEVAFNRVMRGSADGSGIGTSAGIIQGMQWNFPALQISPFVGVGVGDGVRVAVLDSGAAYEDYADDLGVYAQAPDLANVAFAPGIDVINGDDHPNDDHGHGTHVTGIIAASDGAAALAPGVEIMPIKVLDADNLGTELALAEGVRYAVDNGADVINMSLSFPPTYFPSRYMQAAVDYASANGVIMIAAVGNHDVDVVTYPAAFRDVIAVGATSIHPWFRPAGGRVDELPENADRWQWVYHWLERAPYSNRGYAVDVVAPGGRLDRDEDGDGNPEAIVGQAFEDDPTDIEYMLFAGTSQAAAQVTGVAAVMLRENPDMTPYDVRAVLGESAGRTSWDVLSSTTGRGRVRADNAVAGAAVASATALRDQFSSAMYLSVERVTDGARRAVARVEVLDETGAPVPFARVFGAFTGAAFERRSGWTNWDGVATFRSSEYGQDGRIVAFQVDSIAGYGWFANVDRPRGFVRIDSLSLQLLAEFAATMDELPPLGDGAPSNSATGADDESGGTGIGTSAGTDTGGTGIGTSAGDEVPPTIVDDMPILIAYDLPVGDSSYTPPEQVVSTLSLTNFSWGQATVPIAVVVEETWFFEQFPEAAQRRVVAFGSGIGDSAIEFDPVESFPVELPPPGGEIPPPRLDLVLATYAIGSGIATSPGFRPIFPDVFYGVADDVAITEDAVDLVLDMWWTYHYDQVAGSGIATSPGFTADLGISEGTFGHLGTVVKRHVQFGLGADAAPVGAYGSVLEAAGVDLVPVDPLADGGGIGTSVSFP